LQLRIPLTITALSVESGCAATLVRSPPRVTCQHTAAGRTQIWQAIGKSGDSESQKAIEVLYDANAVIESTRVSSEHRADGKISASVLPNGECEYQ